LGHFSLLLPSSTIPPSFPHFQAEPVLPLPLILLKRRYKHNKEDKAFLLVELRIPFVDMKNLLNMQTEKGIVKESNFYL
jgi:hypothetical protein